MKELGDDQPQNLLIYRRGPISPQTCTDFYCCVLYLLMIAAVGFLGIYTSAAPNMTQAQIRTALGTQRYGNLILTVVQNFKPILFSLVFCLGLSFFLLVITLVVSSLVAVIFVGLILFMTLLGGVFLLLRYLSITIPYIDPAFQSTNFPSKSPLCLGTAVLLLTAFVVSILLICTRKERFKSILPSIRIASFWFWDNSSVIIISFVLSCISILAIAINVFILGASQQQIPEKAYVQPIIVAALVLAETLWTHGFLQALSDYLFQSFAVHWYFTKTHEKDNYSQCSHSLCPSFSSAFKHIGTIVFGSLFAWIPESLNHVFNRMESRFPCCYSYFCCLHKCLFRRLSKYCFTETILKSTPFLPSTANGYYLRQQTKSEVPSLYMVGNFYMTLCKVLVVMCTMTTCFFLMQQQSNEVLSIAWQGPPLFVVFLASTQIATHYINAAGLVADTILLMHSLDLSIEKNSLRRMTPFSCPEPVLAIIEAEAFGYND